MRQEARKKDIERLLVVLLAGFKGLQKEIRRWFIHEFTKVSQTRAILHKLIVRMQQNGAILEDSEREGNDFDLLTELHDHELSLAE